MVCYKAALDEYVNSLLPSGSKPFSCSPHKLPVLINGDDIYFRCNPVFYKIWFKYITIAGFKLSIGKNYVHNNIFTINSQCFIFSDIKTAPRELFFYNVGLVMGRSKSGPQEPEMPIGDIYNKIMIGAHNVSSAHRRFIYYNLDKIRMATYGGKYQLFLPPCLGGLGFIVPTAKNDCIHIESEFPFDKPVILRRSIRKDRVQATKNKLNRKLNTAHLFVDRPIDFQLAASHKSLALYLHNNIVDIHNTPTLEESCIMSCPHLVNLNKPDYVEEYQGEHHLLSIHNTEEAPIGYSLPEQICKQDALFTYIVPEQLISSMKYEGIKSSVWWKFCKSKKYRGVHDLVGFDACSKGLYPWKVYKSILPDLESKLNNLIKVKNTMKVLEYFNELPHAYRSLEELEAEGVYSDRNFPSTTLPTKTLSYESWDDTKCTKYERVLVDSIIVPVDFEEVENQLREDVVAHKASLLTPLSVN